MVTENEEETPSAQVEATAAEAETERPAPAAPPPRPRRRPYYPPRRKVCPFCVDKVRLIDYKDAHALRRFLSDRGRIEPRRKVGTCAKHQRALALAIKRARHLALLPFTPEHIRRTGFSTS